MSVNVLDSITTMTLLTSETHHMTCETNPLRASLAFCQPCRRENLGADDHQSIRQRMSKSQLASRTIVQPSFA